MAFLYKKQGGSFEIAWQMYPFEDRSSIYHTLTTELELTSQFDTNTLLKEIETIENATNWFNEQKELADVMLIPVVPLLFLIELSLLHMVEKLSNKIIIIEKSLGQLYPKTGFDDRKNYLSSTDVEPIDYDDFPESYSLGRSEIWLLRKAEELSKKNISSIFIADDRITRQMTVANSSILSTFGLILLLVSHNLLSKDRAITKVQKIAELGLLFDEELIQMMIQKIEQLGKR